MFFNELFVLFFILANKDTSAGSILPADFNNHGNELVVNFYPWVIITPPS